MASDEAADFYLGDKVEVVRLVNAAQHNGKIAVVIALADPATGRVGVRLHDGFEFRIKPCNCELFQAGLLREQLDFKEYIRSHPFPSLLECIGRDPPYAAYMNSEVYTISRSIYETLPFDATDTAAKAAGERLYALGGIDTMRAVYYLLTRCHYGFLTLEHTFDGIGSWRA